MDKNFPKYKKLRPSRNMIVRYAWRNKSNASLPRHRVYSSIADIYCAYRKK